MNEPKHWHQSGTDQLWAGAICTIPVTPVSALMIEIFTLVRANSLMPGAFIVPGQEIVPSPPPPAVP